MYLEVTDHDKINCYASTIQPNLEYIESLPTPTWIPDLSTYPSP